MNDSLCSCRARCCIPEELFKILIKERVNMVRYSTGRFMDDVAAEIERMFYNENEKLMLMIAISKDGGIYSEVVRMLKSKKELKTPR